MERSVLERPFRDVGAATLLVVRAAKTGHKVRPRDVIEQVYEVGYSSLPLVFFGMAFFGAVMVTIADAQIRRAIGSLSIVGPMYCQLLLREFGPMAAALLVAARAAAHTSAELSAMSVNEQVEALEMSAGDPLRDLVAPRLWGGIIALPLLSILGTTTAGIAAAVTAGVLGSDPWAFLDPSLVQPIDLVAGFVKSLACGLFIPAVACERGLSAKGGAAAVGFATTEAVVTACIGVLAIDLSLGYVFWVISS